MPSSIIAGVLLFLLPCALALCGQGVLSWVGYAALGTGAALLVLVAPGALPKRLASAGRGPLPPCLLALLSAALLLLCVSALVPTVLTGAFELFAYASYALAEAVWVLRMVGQAHVGNAEMYYGGYLGGSNEG